MWKKVKRILSCILALILLLSLIDGQQFFVRAESEVKATQTEQASNKMEETETSSRKEEGSEANNKENGKQEEGTQKEELSTKATEKTTETKNEDGKVDKPDNLNKENENNGQENGGKNEEKETGDKGEETIKEKAEEASAEEDTAQETEAKEQIDATDDTQERMNQQDENVPAMAQRGTDVSEKETEYVPKSQPQGVSIKVYAKENVFPEGTTMKVKELTNEELDSAQNVLEKGNVSYDGFLGYDISFYNKEGKEIEPEEGSVRVEVDMNLNLLPKDLQIDTLQMQHLKEEKKDRTVETVAKAADHKLSVSKSKVTAKFEVKSFSDFILTWNIDATPADPLETGDNAVSIEKQINHEKYATLRDDGTYDLTLTVAGKKGTETNKAKLDVIYILDKSGSMKEDFGGTSKRIAASNAITALTKSLKQNANIDATEKAYENYQKNLTDNKDENEKGYKDAADAGTGTHAGEKGMYTNENSEAKMTYTFRGEEYTELYDKPVIKLHPGKLILEKEVEGLDSLTPEQLEQYKANLKFKIKVKTKNDTSLKEEEITLTAFAKESNGNEDSGSDSNTNRRNKYIYTVMEGINPGSFYEITEDGGEVEGYTWETAADKKSENGTIAKDETEKVSFKNTYSRKKFPLIINKTVEGNMSEKRKEFAFSITLKDANGAAYELSDEEIKDVGFSTKGEDQKGVYTFTLKDGESKEFSLPYGCKYTISEEDYSSSGYKTYIGEKKEENQKRTTEEETLTQKTEINFLNKKEVIPPTGVETTMTAWLLMTGVTLLLGAVFLLFGIRRKRFVA